MTKDIFAFCQSKYLTVSNCLFLSPHDCMVICNFHDCMVTFFYFHTARRPHLYKYRLLFCSLKIFQRFNFHCFKINDITTLTAGAGLDNIRPSSKLKAGSEIKYLGQPSADHLPLVRILDSTKNCV